MLIDKQQLPGFALRNAVGGNTGAYLANLAANQTANTLNKES